MKKYFKRKPVVITSILAIILFFLIFSLFDFYTRLERREYRVQVDNMMNASQQDSFIMESKMEGYVDALKSMAEFLRDGELKSEKHMAHIKAMVEDLDFQRLGIADASGSLTTMDGYRSNIANLDAFMQAGGGEPAISKVQESTISGNQVFLILVPIPDENGTVRGVLYGEMEVGHFRLYKQDQYEKQVHSFQVVDRNGNYILRSEDNDNLAEDGDLFADLKMIGSEEKAAEAVKAIKNGENLFFNGELDGHSYLIYFSPLEINDWYIVTTLDKVMIKQAVSDFLGNDIFLLIIKTLGVFSLMALLVFHFLYRERKKAKDFSARALSGTEGYMTIDLNDDRIQQCSESLTGLCGESNSYSEMLINYAKRRVLPEYESYVQKTISSAALIHAYRWGNTEVSAEYQVREEGDTQFWMECRIHTANDRAVHHIMAFATFRNIDEKKKYELQLMEAAERDSMTGLYNRSKGSELITQYLEENTDPSRTHAFFILDVDNFKSLNDTLGHQMGDRILRDVAKTLKEHFREKDVACRLGGDEFIIFVKDIPMDTLNRNAQALLKKLLRTYQKDGQDVTVSASVGIAVSPLHGTSYKELYKKADIALYEVKNGSKNNFKIYDEP